MQRNTFLALTLMALFGSFACKAMEDTRKNDARSELVGKLLGAFTRIAYDESTLQAHQAHSESYQTALSHGLAEDEFPPVAAHQEKTPIILVGSPELAAIHQVHSEVFLNGQSKEVKDVCSTYE